jgi:hypothetical protein
MRLADSVTPRTKLSIKTPSIAPATGLHSSVNNNRANASVFNVLVQDTWTWSKVMTRSRDVASRQQYQIQIVKPHIAIEEHVCVRVRTKCADVPTYVTVPFSYPAISTPLFDFARMSLRQQTHRLNSSANNHLRKINVVNRPVPDNLIAQCAATNVNRLRTAPPRQ